MYQDKYLTNCKHQYALRMAKIVKNYEKDLLEYIFHQLKPQERIKLNSTIERDTKKELQNDLSSKVVILSANPRTNLRKIGVDEEWLKSKIRALKDSENDPIFWAQQMMMMMANFPNLKKILLNTLQRKLNSSFKAGKRKTEYQINLDSFATIFKLTEKEKNIVTFLHLERTDTDVDNYFTSHHFDLTNLTKSTKFFCRFFELKPAELRSSLSQDSVLIKAGIIKKGRKEDTIKLSDSVVAYLGGTSKTSIIDEYVKEVSLKEIIQLRDHNVSHEKTQPLIHLLKSKGGCNIILHGHPGTGKTEFSKSLAAVTGKRLYFINQSDEDGDESLTFRKQAIIAAHNIVHPDDSIIVVDECDTILNIFNGMWKCETDDSNDRKAWINDFLEKTKHKIIWISNKTEGIDESTKRRFSFSLEFHPLSCSQRKKVWQTQIKKQNVSFIEENEVNDLAKNLKVNSGGITLALKNIESMQDIETKEQKLDVLKSILTQHESFLSGEKTSILQKTNKYSTEILNTDYPLDKLLTYAEQFIKERKEFHNKGVYNLNVLLQGPPGTGKTEFVKHLAEMTDRELVVKRGSDIRSKWYGESVRNIASSFKEAQENGSILFFDEADSFFGSRESGNEYHAQETNEFLTQMENFQGLLVCATNFTQKLDQASMRRFNYKVKFDFLNPHGKKLLFEKYFSDHLIDGSDSSLWERLGRIPGLTPGDFKVVYQKNIFNEKRSADDFLRDLEAEVSYKNEFSKKVGLC